ncbi:MAG: hypothetical protein M1834_000765 [Cirrosporium novae-zelandiae]|nr:MAG: hypothetical protein M1834_000765 [Cirrosporium novae-zelandiae]
MSSNSDNRHPGAPPPVMPCTPQKNQQDKNSPSSPSVSKHPNPILEPVAPLKPTYYTPKSRDPTKIRTVTAPFSNAAFHGSMNSFNNLREKFMMPKDQIQALGNNKDRESEKIKQLPQLPTESLKAARVLGIHSKDNEEGFPASAPPFGGAPDPYRISICEGESEISPSRQVHSTPSLSQRDVTALMANINAGTYIPSSEAIPETTKEMHVQGNTPKTSGMVLGDGSTFSTKDGDYGTVRKVNLIQKASKERVQSAMAEVFPGTPLSQQCLTSQHPTTASTPTWARIQNTELSMPEPPSASSVYSPWSAHGGWDAMHSILPNTLPPWNDFSPIGPRSHGSQDTFGVPVTNADRSTIQSVPYVFRGDPSQLSYTHDPSGGSGSRNGSLPGNNTGTAHKDTDENAYRRLSTISNFTPLSEYPYGNVYNCFPETPDPNYQTQSNPSVSQVVGAHTMAMHYHLQTEMAKLHQKLDVQKDTTIDAVLKKIDKMESNILHVKNSLTKTDIKAVKEKVEGVSGGLGWLDKNNSKRIEELSNSVKAIAEQVEEVQRSLLSGEVMKNEGSNGHKAANDLAAAITSSLDTHKKSLDGVFKTLETFMKKIENLERIVHTITPPVSVGSIPMSRTASSNKYTSSQSARSTGTLQSSTAAPSLVHRPHTLVDNSDNCARGGTKNSTKQRGPKRCKSQSLEPRESRERRNPSAYDHGHNHLRNSFRDRNLSVPEVFQTPSGGPPVSFPEPDIRMHPAFANSPSRNTFPQNNNQNTSSVPPTPTSHSHPQGMMPMATPAPAQTQDAINYNAMEPMPLGNAWAEQQMVNMGWTPSTGYTYGATGASDVGDGWYQASFGQGGHWGHWGQGGHGGRT